MEATDKRKEELYKACTEHITKRIHTIEQTLQSIEESRNTETKSSVGDKYETGRAMMQMEENKSKAQLFQAVQIRNKLLKIDPQKRMDRVAPGSLVNTSQGIYYIAIGIGKLMLKNTLYYCISSNSPIGTKLMHKKPGDIIEFNGNHIHIEAIC